MKYSVAFTVAVILFFVAAFSLPREVDAVPAFARQTGLACNTCHFQHYPLLNQFGRAFKSSGYTQVGGQSLVEGDILSLPSTINASLVTKIRYQKTNGKDTTASPENGSTGTNRGELQFPDEAALFLGGRIGEHIGFLLEAALPDADDFTSFKMPFSYDVAGVNVNIIPFTTDALGASFGYELLNTGAVRNIRGLEHRTETAAQQYIGTATAAEGFAFAIGNNLGFVNYSLWGPGHGATDWLPFAHYVRAAVTPQIGDWDVGGGIQWWGGSGKYSSTTTAQTVDTTTSNATQPVDSTDTRSTSRVTIDAWAVDFQAQGMVSTLPLGIYLTYANAGKSDTDGPANFFNSSTNGSKKAWTVVAELGVRPGRATVALGYRAGDDGTSANSEQNAVTFGATYFIAQNVELQLNHSAYNGDYYDLPANNEEANGDQLTTLMLFAAF